MSDHRQTHYAGLGIRFGALAIDLLLFCALFFPVTRLVKGVWLISSTDHRWVKRLFITDPLCLIFLVLMVLYFILLEGLTGATLGKWALGLRVASEEYLAIYRARSACVERCDVGCADCAGCDAAGNGLWPVRTDRPWMVLGRPAALCGHFSAGWRPPDAGLGSHRASPGCLCLGMGERAAGLFAGRCGRVPCAGTD